MTENTYTGPAIENEGRSTSTPGGVYVAVGVALIALIVGFIGIWVGSSADTKADGVNNRVTKLQNESTESWAKQLKWNDKTSIQLAAQATQIDLLEVDVAKLASKAEQKIVDRLIEEMKDKASVTRVRDLASDMLNKADKDAVNRIVRKVNKMNSRLIAVEGIVLPKPAPAPAAPPPPPVAPPEVRRQATLPAGEAIKAEQARIDAQRAVPVGRPEAPAVKLPPAK